MEKIILYPCSYDNLREVDEDYKFEEQIANKFGINTVTFNYDAFVTFGEKLKIHSNIELNKDNMVTAVYRGWMLLPEKYKELYDNLLELGIKLVNNPDEYENAHCFNKAYKELEEYTPKILVFNKDEKINWINVQKIISKFIVKDFVKSVKGFDFEHYLDFTYTDNELDNKIEKFKKLRGNLYTGGIILKEYVDLDRSGGKTHEFRGFYYNGRLVTLYQNSNNTEDEIKNVIKFANSIPKLKSKFYTVDFAIKKNGETIVIETGDGQVSGIDSEEEVSTLYNYIFFKQRN